MASSVAAGPARAGAGDASTRPTTGGSAGGEGAALGEWPDPRHARHRVPRARQGPLCRHDPVHARRLSGL